MVVIGVAGAIVWQAGLMPNIEAFVESQPVLKSLTFWQTQTPPEQTSPTPAAQPEQPAAAPAPPATAEAPSEPKPSPLPSAPAADADATNDAGTPPADTAQATPPVQTAPPPVAAPPVTAPVIEKAAPAPAVTRPVRAVKIPAEAHMQDVWVSTDPPGAKAVLDDDLNQECRTPCMVHASTGTHHLTISQAGFENEYREIHVGETAQDLPPITLRKPSGTLLLTTTPAGATVRVDGRLLSQVTPATISLPPGTYNITVEKGGQQRSQKVEIQQSLVYLRIPLNP